MKARGLPLAALNLFLIIAMIAVGLPGIVASAIRLPSETVIKALELGQPMDKAAVDQAAVRLEKTADWSNAARSDLALAMLAQGPSVTDRVAADHAARQLRLYLAEAPDDSLAWANLALAELRRGTLGAAVTAYRMSIELAPYMATSLVSRCRFGVDLYAALDDDGKAMLAHQCQMAMDPSFDDGVSRDLVESLDRKGALALAKVLMSGDSQASHRFERLAHKP